MGGEPWLIHFFQRYPSDDPGRGVPARDCMDGLPRKALAEMSRLYEVRVQGGGMNHRLFCVLERGADDLGGSSIVAIDG